MICLGHIKCQGMIILLSDLHVQININVPLKYSLKRIKIRRCPCVFICILISVNWKETVTLTMYFALLFYIRKCDGGKIVLYTCSIIKEWIQVSYCVNTSLKECNFIWIQLSYISLHKDSEGTSTCIMYNKLNELQIDNVRKSYI